MYLGESRPVTGQVVPDAFEWDRMRVRDYLARGILVWNPHPTVDPLFVTDVLEAVPVNKLRDLATNYAPGKLDESKASKADLVALLLETSGAVPPAPEPAPVSDGRDKLYRLPGGADLPQIRAEQEAHWLALGYGDLEWSSSSDGGATLRGTPPHPDSVPAVDQFAETADVDEVADAAPPVDADPSPAAALYDALTDEEVAELATKRQLDTDGLDRDGAVRALLELDGYVAPPPPVE